MPAIGFAGHALVPDMYCRTRKTAASVAATAGTFTTCVHTLGVELAPSSIMASI